MSEELFLLICRTDVFEVKNYQWYGSGIYYDECGFGKYMSFYEAVFKLRDFFESKKLKLNMNQDIESIILQAEELKNKLV